MSAKRLKVELTVGHFSRDSFDRFGDDLTEEVLQYLTFSDKVRLELVSKQWKRCIFQKEFVVQLTKRQDISKKMIVENKVQVVSIKKIFVPSLELLKKCSNIRTAILWEYTKRIDFSLLAQYCPQLKRLELSVSYLEDIEFFKFGWTHGHRLIEIKFYGVCPTSLNGNMVMFLGLCSNLKKIDVPSQYNFIKNDDNFLPKLENFESLVIEDQDQDNHLNQMKVLTHKYHKTMKCLNIMFILLTTDELKTCLTQLSLFESLETLKLEIVDYDQIQYDFIDQYFEELTRKCTKLKNLSLALENDSLISEHFLKVLTHLKDVQKLDLRLGVSKKLKGGFNQGSPMDRPLGGYRGGK